MGIRKIRELEMFITYWIQYFLDIIPYGSIQLQKMVLS